MIKGYILDINYNSEFLYSTFTKYDELIKEYSTTAYSLMSILCSHFDPKEK